jgi:TRAP-type C4-dicarboxylate transport system permease small subunit
MSHGLELGLAQPLPQPGQHHPVLALLERLLGSVNRAMMVPCMLALASAALILSYSVFARYFFKIPTEWQDESAIFLLVGATFFSGAYVQSQRGHIGIDAVAGWLSPAQNRIRILFNHLVCTLFCGFFSWKSWALFAEALHEGHTTTSTWGPPMWIPYAIMAAGMSLLALQFLLEWVLHLEQPGRAK